MLNVPELVLILIQKSYPIFTMLIILKCVPIMSWINPEVFTMVYNVPHHLVLTTFQIAFATKPLPLFALITVALGGIHQASSHLEVFVLLFSLHLKLFIQIVTELISSLQLANSSNIPTGKVLSVSYPKQYTLTPFILFVAPTATWNYILLSASATRIHGS